MSRYTHDIIIIGAGSAGLTCAQFMKRAGFSVLLVDRTATSFGGECLNSGCVPSKALIHAAKLANATQKATISLSTSAETPHFSFEKVQQYVASRVEHIRQHEHPDYLNTLGIDTAIGAAAFTGKHSIIVAEKEFSARRIIIATGSRPRPLPTPTDDSIPIYTNETIFSLTQLPRSIVFIGGGPICIELAQAFRRLGSNVTVLQSAERIVPKEDESVSRLLTATLAGEGVEVHCNATVHQIKDAAVDVTLKDGTRTTLSPDIIFAGIGRLPNTESLNSEAAGIRRQEDGSFVLDKYGRTTNRSVVVIGDAAAGLQFTHAAELQAQRALNNLFSPLKKAMRFSQFSWVTFTDPEIATFGYAKETLQHQRRTFKTVSVPMHDEDRAITDDATAGFLTLYLSKRGRILGGTLVGDKAGEIANELVLMMHLRIPLKKVLDKPFAYPTSSRIIQSAAREYYGETLFSPFTQKLLQLLYR